MLAVATFSAVRSSNRTARISLKSRSSPARAPTISSLPGDPDHKVLWHDRHAADVSGGRAIFEEKDGVIYLAIGLRNLGTGLALFYGWHSMPDQAFKTCHTSQPKTSVDSPSTSTSRRAVADIREAAVRDRDDRFRPGFMRSLRTANPSRSTSTVTNKADSVR